MYRTIVLDLISFSLDFFTSTRYRIQEGKDKGENGEYFILAR